MTSCGDPWDIDLDGFLSAWDYGTDGGFSRTFSIDPVTKKAVARITNNTCRSVTLSLAAYKMYDTRLSTQVFFSGSGNVTINGYSTVTLQVDVPSCMAQVDLWFGLHPFQLLDSNPYWTPGYIPHFLDVRYYQNNGTSYSNASGNFCSNATPTPTPTPNPYGVCKDANADGKYDQCVACQGAACTGPTCLIANGAGDCQGCNNNGICEPERGEDPTTCPNDCKPLRCGDSDGDNVYDSCKIGNTGPVCNSLADCFLQAKCVNFQCVAGAVNGVPSCLTSDTVGTYNAACGCPAGTSPDPTTKQCTCDNGATNPPKCDVCPTGQTMVGGKCVPKGFCADANQDGIYDQCDPKAKQGVACTTATVQADCIDGVRACRNRACTPGATGSQYCRNTVDCVCNNDGKCDVSAGEDPTTCSSDCGYCSKGGSTGSGSSLLYDFCSAYGTGNNYCSRGATTNTEIQAECLGCDNDGICEAERGENPVTCPNDCKCPAGTSPDPTTKQCTCDNGATNPPKCDQCPTGYSLVNGQCKPDCGNGICEVNKGENPTTCPKDCGYCGAPNPGALYNQCTVNGNSNNFCSLGQSFSTTECLGCDNDGICEAERGENPVTCPNDCKCAPGQTVCASTGQCVNSTCGGFGVYNPAICACQCPAGMLPGPSGSCQCPPNSVRSGGSCIVCRPGTHPDTSQTVCVSDGKECLACGCVEKVAEGLDNQPIDIVGNGQTFKYRIIIENRSLETDTAVAEYDFNVYDYINAKQTFTRDVVGNQEDPFSREGYLTFDPASVRVESNRNCDGSQADVNLGGFAPGRNIGSVVIPSVNKTNSSTVGYPPIRISNLKSINNPACGGSGDWSRVEITYQATAHTNQPGHELKNHGFVQVTNEVLTCNDVKCVNDDQADIIVSRSAIASSNAGTTFFGAGTARGAAVNLSSLQALYESITKTSTNGKPVSNFAGVLLSSVTDLFSSYLRSVLFADTQNYDQAIDSSASGVLRGVASGTTTTPNVTVSSETDLPALLMRRADDASIYQATDGLTVNMTSPAGSGNSFDRLSTVIVKKGNLLINSNITTGPNGNIAFVVQEGNIVIAPNVTRIDAILVVQNKDYGIIGNGVRSNVPLVINGSVYGNFESKNPKRLLTEDRVIVGAPGVVPNAVTVNYSAKILTLLPPGLKSILTAAQFGQVVGSGG